MERLNTIIKGIIETLDKQGLIRVSEDCVLEQAVKIMISENIDRSQKEQRGISTYQKPKIINPSIPTKSNNDITPKQKAFLIKVKKYKEGMTKQEAFQIIAEMSKPKEKYKEY